MIRAFGLMSGTSLDGIDVADVEIERARGRNAIRLLHFATLPIPGRLRETVRRAMPPSDADVACVGELNAALGEAFAMAALDAARTWGVDLASVDVIGSHGQTLYHAPEDGITMQIGEPATIAARTGVTCVADFRAADVAHGGQGAPLVPFVDHQLFGDDVEHRAALNIGGIANITLLPPGTRAEDVRACDCGPGNLAIDECMRRASHGAYEFDAGGATAARGVVDARLLDELLADPYFARRGPKSTGRERFGAAYAAQIWERASASGLRPEDVVATVTALTARTIAAQVPAECVRTIVSGGGAGNATLLAMLRAAAPQSVFETSDARGVPSGAKEAIAFAMLAGEAIAGESASMPACTGARRGAVLGKIVPGDNFGRLMKKMWG